LIGASVKSTALITVTGGVLCLVGQPLSVCRAGPARPGWRWRWRCAPHPRRGHRL